MHCLFGCTQWNELWNRDDEKGHNTCLVLMVVKRIWKGTRLGYKVVYFYKNLLMTYSNPIV